MKKGFTLIELLAVILILGIIALIAIPTVNKIIYEAKASSFKTSNDNIMKVIKQDCQVNQIKGKNGILSYVFNEGKSSSNINIKGSIPNEGYILLNKQCDITNYYLTDGKNIYSNEEDIREIYMLKNSSVNNSIFKDYYSSYYNKIISVNFVNHLNISENAILIKDLSMSGNEKIKSWLVPNEENYDLYVGSEGTIYANYNSANLFSNLTKVTKYDLSNFNTSFAKTISYMFLSNESVKELDLSNFNTSNVENLSYMFDNCYLLESLNLLSFNTSNVTNMQNMFDDCGSLSTIDVSNFDTSNVTNMHRMFGGYEKVMNLKQIRGLENFDTKNVTSMGFMFSNCKYLASLNLNNFDTSNVTNMTSIFENCKSLTSLNLSNFNTSKVNSMSYMFNNCKSLINLNINHFDVKNVTNMNYMFTNCESLKELDLSNWDTKKVQNMAFLFDNCFSLENINLNNWNTTSVLTMNNMFDDCCSLSKIDVSSFNTSNVTNMWRMFGGSEKVMKLTEIKGLENFDISKVSTVEYMFSNCQSLQSLNLSNWQFNNEVLISNIFSGCYILTNITVNNISSVNKFAGALPNRTGNTNGTIVVNCDKTGIDISTLSSKNWNVV